MRGGRLDSADLVVKILKERFSKDDFNNDFILDGFPRNVSQAEELKKMVHIDKVVEITLSDETAVKRICGRRNCSKCGAIFNVYTFKPKVKNVCDKCGGELFARKDDNEEALKERLRFYHKETEPILKMYDSIKVDGEKSVEECFEDVLRVLG
jgi:adenylate kinase